jgi:hypothetical protein
MLRVGFVIKELSKSRYIMLALVKMPHTEIAINGNGTEEIIEWIRSKYPIVVLGEDQADKSVPIEETTFWKTMQTNRVGNLLEGYRLKAGVTQAMLAEKTGIR